MNCINAIGSHPLSSYMTQATEMPTPLQTRQPLPRLSRTPDTQPRTRPGWRFGGMIRGFCALAILIGSSLQFSALAGPPPGNLGQLQQLNRASGATLGNIQRPSVPSPTVKHQTNQQKSLDRWQRADLQRLQERQRREMLLLNHRANTGTLSGPAQSLRGIDMQRRFQRQQQHRLNRYRLQR